MNAGLGFAAGFILAYFFIFFLIGMGIKNNSIVDFGWGLGFVLAAFGTAVFSGTFDGVTWLLLAMVSLWGLRLSYHIFLRNHGKPEDFRYANWRREWGKWVVPRAFLQVYLLQAIMMMLVGYGLFYANTVVDKRFGILVTLGIGVWLIGYFFEVVGDYQLAAFKKNPENKGKIIMHGLWRYSRHPNYFGEATMWWGIFLIVWGSTGNIGAVVSPLWITYLLLFVSGVPMLEKKYQGNAAFEAYAQVTPKFFPWRPKKRGQ